MDINAFGGMPGTLAPLRNRQARRIYFMETLFQMIIHCAEDGNSSKINKIIDNLYTLGLMPVTQADLDGFAEEFTRPTDTGSYYVVNDRRLHWIEDNDIAHLVLRADEFGMTELTFTDEAGEARFRSFWM
ncbi:hypothetical protein [Sphingobium sp.]|uniref:hypothetical protein n=1 Tax=Sphingobium sp. TaxID=1912891 RepID=UPI002CDFCF1A|nr:hypothetical protein [Sphingobium sp.]HUD95657.1 hypothetical protein [Sphingobium sp.]